MKESKGIYQRMREEGNVINVSEILAKIRAMSPKELSEYFQKTLREIERQQYGRYKGK